MKSKETALAKATVIGTLAKVLDLLCMEMSAGAEQSSLLVSEAGPAEKKHCYPTQSVRPSVAA